MQRWEHFHHMADIGVRGYGETMAAAFEQAATALTEVITNPATVRPAEEIRIRCEAPDAELLLVDWLNALVYEMAVRRMLFCRFSVRVTDTVLQATVMGEPIDRARHHPAVEVKGATYTELRVARTDDGLWLAQCVIDV
jgi:protein archease